MTHTDRSSAQYVDRFGRRLRHALQPRCRREDLDDIVQSECLRVLEQFDDLAARHPDPEAYALQRSKAGRAIIDHARRQSTQAGRGAVSAFDDEGRRLRGRDVVPGDGRFHDIRWNHYDDRPGRGNKGGSYFDVAAAAAADAYDAALDRLIDLPQLRAALIRLTGRERELLYLVDGLGRTVTEVAQEWGCARETLARLRSGAYRKVRIDPPC